MRAVGDQKVDGTGVVLAGARAMLVRLQTFVEWHLHTFAGHPGLVESYRLESNH